MAMMYLGEIRAFGFGFAPQGWAFANGALLNINTNTALYALLGTTYGGNGTTTFGLPNLQGRAAVGQGPRSGGGPTYTLGQVQGSETTTLLQSNLPPHVHTFTGTLNAVQTKGTAQGPAAGSLLARSVDENGTDNPQIYVPTGTAGTQVGLAGVSGTTAITGNGLPATTQSPILAINYCIAIQGIFPSRN